MKKVMYVLIFFIAILSIRNTVYAKTGESIKKPIILSNSKLRENNSPFKTKSILFNKGEVKWFRFETYCKGEYDIYSNGSVDTVGCLYKKSILGKASLITSDDNSGTLNNFMMKGGLQGGKVYYVAIKAKSKGYVKLTVQIHQDSYKGTAFYSNGGSWTPFDGSYQPYGATQSVIKITWLTPGQAAIYSTGLADSKYLRMLNTGIRLSVVLTTAKIGTSSTIGKYIMRLGNKNVVKIIGTIASSYGGINLVPDMINLSQKAIISKTNKFKNGLKITSMAHYSYGIINAYDSWNLSNTSVKSPKYCRGFFKRGDVKVIGW